MVQIGEICWLVDAAFCVFVRKFCHNCGSVWWRIMMIVGSSQRIMMATPRIYKKIMRIHLIFERIKRAFFGCVSFFLSIPMIVGIFQIYLKLTNQYLICTYGMWHYNSHDHRFVHGTMFAKISTLSRRIDQGRDLKPKIFIDSWEILNFSAIFLTLAWWLVVVGWKCWKSLSSGGMSFKDVDHS